MRVFLDIGSHTGETVAEVVKRKYRFDRIVCFEPAAVCLPSLQEYAAKDDRIEICPFGLGARNEKLELHNPGSLGASVLATGGPTETIEIVDAAEWFRANLQPSDFIVAKANCEGAEVAIVNRLLDEGLADWPVSFMVTFDIRDYPNGFKMERALRRRLRGRSNFCFSDDVMIGTRHDRGIAHWLHLFGIDTGQDRNAVERHFRRNFETYSKKTGRRQRIERAAKARFGYSALPEPIKKVFRFAKRALGLSTEHD